MLWANAGLLLTIVFWGSLIPVLADMLQKWDPYFISVWRYGLAIPVLEVLRRIMEPGPLLPPDVRLGRLWGAGALLAAFATFYTVGVAHSNPITAAVLSACSPVIAGLVEWAGTRVPPHWSLLMAVPLTISGAIIGSVELSGAGGGWGFRGGEPLIVAGSACWALYSLAVKQWLNECTPLRLATLTIAPGEVFLILIYAAVAAAGQTLPLVCPSVKDLIELLWISLGAAVGGILFWNNGVRKLGVTAASLYLNLVPFVAIAVAMLFGVYPRTAQLVGCLLVVAGIVQTQVFRPGRT
ncbi:MAG: DMT family transporter [Thermodesulfobacteriota bacterium]